MQTGGNAVNVSAAGAFLAHSAGLNQTKRLSGARLVAGADAATMTVRETDGSGRILYVLKAPANTSDETAQPATYQGNIFIVLTGTSPTAHVFEP